MDYRDRLTGHPQVMLADEQSGFGESLKRIAQEADVRALQGDWDEAGSLYETVFQNALAERNLETVERALRGLTRCRQYGERHDEAEEFAQLSLKIAELNGLTRSTASAVHLLAVSRYLRGDWQGARDGYIEALERAVDLGDDVLIGMACQNLGVLAGMRGDDREGRLLSLESLAAFVRCGDSKRAMGAYNNLAIACTDLGEWLEAELYYDRGIELAHQQSDYSALGMIYTNRAKPLIHVGEMDRAAESLTRAEEYAIKTQDTGTLSEIELHRAWIARLQSDYSAAASHLDRALAHADTPQLERERALALEGFALLREAEGRIEEARSVLQQVIDSFRELGAERDASRAEALLQSWSSPDHQDSQFAPHPEERSEI